MRRTTLTIPRRPTRLQTRTQGAATSELAQKRLRQFCRFTKRDVENLLKVDLAISGIVIPAKKVLGGLLISATSVIWGEVINTLKRDWSMAYSIPPRKWEEIIAGAFKQAGFEEVVLTPSSGDRGRDVIAIKRGIGCVKIIDSVKAYKPGNLVGYDDVRALLGVLSGERDASKGIITTTSGFPPGIAKDPFIAPFMPTRLELMDGQALQKWLFELSIK